MIMPYYAQCPRGVCVEALGRVPPDGRGVAVQPLAPSDKN
jgi:hypothetical protein